MGFETGRWQQELLNHFNVAALDGFGLRGYHLGMRVAGAILQYLGETQSSALNLLTGLSTYSLADFMVLDAATRRNLELTVTIAPAIYTALSWGFWTIPLHPWGGA